MSRKNFRLVAVVATVLVVTFALLPAAQARDLSGSRAAVHNTTDWFGAAMAWMANLLNLGHRSTGLNHQSSADTTNISSGGTTKMEPTTGSCIDPMGNPSPHCTQ